MLLALELHQRIEEEVLKYFICFLERSVSKTQHQNVNDLKDFGIDAQLSYKKIEKYVFRFLTYIEMLKTLTLTSVVVVKLAGGTGTPRIKCEGNF